MENPEIKKLQEEKIKLLDLYSAKNEGSKFYLAGQSSQSLLLSWAGAAAGVNIVFLGRSSRSLKLFWVGGAGV